MAETSGSTKYQLRILVQPPKPGSSGWEAAVYLGGACFAKDITLSDPFTTAEKDECRWYLEDYLSKSPFEKARADIVTESLNSYADSLFNQLRLSRVWRRLSVPTSPMGKFLEIDIFEANEDSNAISSDTIHRLRWEVLEHPRLWKNVIVQTTVRRVIPQKETSSLSINQIESWPEGVPAVNILLVISRMLVRKGQVEVDPDLVRHSLQKRGIESSDFFADPVSTNFGSFSARDFMDWNHLRTLHRHFHHTGRPHLALKTMSYVLKRYEPSERAPTLPTLTPENLERERCFKWFYEAVLQRKRCLQLIAEQDYDAALPLLNVIVGDVRDAPEKLREFVPKKLLCELDNELKKFNLAALVISIVSIAASGM